MHPIQQFAEWFAQAKSANIQEHDAMTLATLNAKNQPSARTVLLKHYDENGFIFFTNYNSRKGNELANNPFAALLFWWSKLDKQIRIEGKAEKISAQESENYFHQRPRLSQLNAWVSAQSQIIPNREYLLQRQKELAKKFEGQALPCPDYWGGYRIKPSYFEFWQGDQYRLHDRLVYFLNEKNSWETKCLAP